VRGVDFCVFWIITNDRHNVLDRRVCKEGSSNPIVNETRGNFSSECVRRPGKQRSGRGGPLPPRSVWHRSEGSPQAHWQVPVRLGSRFRRSPPRPSLLLVSSWPLAQLTRPPRARRSRGGVSPAGLFFLWGALVCLWSGL